MTRVGLLGYGSSGRGIHAPLLREAGLEVVAISTGNPDRVAEAGGDFPAAAVVPTPADLLAVPGLDVVVLASPSGLHVAHARAVIDARLPVVVDKPLAVDAPSARDLVAYAAQAAVPLVVFQNRRFDAEHATLRRVLADGLVGDIHRLEMRWERWRPVPKDRWRENSPAAEGGGILLDLFSHLVDEAVDLLGPVSSVFATVDAWTTPAEDDAFVVCRHASGVVSHLGATSVSGAPGPRARILGSGAAYVLSALRDEPDTVAELADSAGARGWLYRGSEREPVTLVPSRQADFYRRVEVALGEPTAAARQATMPVDPADAVHVLEVIDAARRSAAENRVVTIRAVAPAGAPR